MLLLLGGAGGASAAGADALLAGDGSSVASDEGGEPPRARFLSAFSLRPSSRNSWYVYTLTTGLVGLRLLLLLRLMEFLWSGVALSASGCGDEAAKIQFQSSGQVQALIFKGTVANDSALDGCKGAGQQALTPCGTWHRR